MPDYIKHSAYLSGNDLGKLGNIEILPSTKEIKEFKNSESYQKIKVMLEKASDNEQAVYYYTEKPVGAIKGTGSFKNFVEL